MAKATRISYSVKDRIAKAKEIRELRKTMTIEAACKKANVNLSNYRNWDALLSKGSTQKTPQVALKRLSKNFPQALTKLPAKTENNKMLSMNISGSTDMMFVGFGKSQDVLQALNNLASIFSRN